MADLARTISAQEEAAGQRAGDRGNRSDQPTTLAARLVATVGADGFAVAGLLVLSLFVFWVRVRLDEGYFNGDILTQFMPLYTEVAAA